MKKLHTLIRNLSIFSILSLFLYVGVQQASAATIDASPASESETTGNSFFVDIIISGAGQTFNASKATVTVSNNLLVEDVILGDCGFSFVQTPTTTNLSFVGVILGSSSQNCTAYTIKLLPTTTGTGQVNLFDGSVKRAGDAAELLTAVTNGSYSISGTTVEITATTTPTPTPTATTTSTNTTQTTIPSTETEEATYDVSLKVYTQNNDLMEGATVVVTPQDGESTSKTPISSKTDSSGAVHLTGIPAGTNVITVENKGKRIVDQVVTMSGADKTMVLSVKEEPERQSPWVIIGIISIVFVCLLVGLILFFKKKYFV